MLIYAIKWKALPPAGCSYHRVAEYDRNRYMMHLITAFNYVYEKKFGVFHIYYPSQLDYLGHIDVTKIVVYTDHLLTEEQIIAQIKPKSLLEFHHCSDNIVNHMVEYFKKILFSNIILKSIKSFYVNRTNYIFEQRTIIKCAQKNILQ